MTSLKSQILHMVSNRWKSYIENPIGFPNDPPAELCWKWTGPITNAEKLYISVSPKRADTSLKKAEEDTVKRVYPQVGMFDTRVSPKVLLYCLHNNIYDRTPPRLRTDVGCQHPCVNPRHQNPSLRYIDEHKYECVELPANDLSDPDPEKDHNGHTITSYMTTLAPCRSLDDVNNFLDALEASPEFRERILKQWTR